MAFSSKDSPSHRGLPRGWIRGWAEQNNVEPEELRPRDREALRNKPSDGFPI